MATSQNGYSANDRSVIASYTVPGSTRQLSMRKGDVSVVLLDIAAWIHAHVAPIDTGILDDWGYAERTIRGSSTTLSNHASGTAIDIDATRHPLGVTGTWTAAAKSAIHGRLVFYEGVIRWGEDYTGRLDGMHFEINANAAAVQRIANKIRAGAGATTGGFLMALSDAEQGELLALARNLNFQLYTGPGNKGWATFGGGTNESLTVVDYLRRANVQLETLKAQVAAYETGKTGPASLTNADLDNVAARVVALLGKKASA